MVISIKDLHKTYKVGFWAKKVEILKGVNLEIGAGESFGLLGPNGAGKTTTLKILVGLVYPTKGEVTIFDKPPNNTQIKKLIGFLPENPYIYTYLTGKEILTLAGRIFKISDKLLNTRIKELLELVNLSIQDSNKQLKTYSKGMLQRICLAQALINDPELVLLDEPLSGLDPIGRHEVKKIIQILKQQGKTIFFNTHILSDVEEMCDRVAIMVGGKIIKEGKIEDLVSPIDNLFQIKVKGLNDVGKNNLKRISIKLVTENFTTIATFNDFSVALKAINIAKQSGGNVLELSKYKTNLEEIFVETVNSVNKE